MMTAEDVRRCMVVDPICAELERISEAVRDEVVKKCRLNWSRWSEGRELSYHIQDDLERRGVFQVTPER